MTTRAKEGSEHQPLVDIMTPVYNGAPYLAECIESVLSQTYTNWRFTIVDNASTDDTSAIAERYANSDPRIRHARFSSHVGSTENHNRALGQLSRDSAYCKIVAADDWLYPECLQRMISVATAKPSVAVVGAYQRAGDSVFLTSLPYDTVFFPGRSLIAWCLRQEINVTGSPTAVLLRSEVVRDSHHFYEPGLRHDDTDAVFRILVNHDFGFVHQVLTYARRQGGTQWDYSVRIGSQESESLLQTVRYGPHVLEPGELASIIADRTRRYVLYQLKQALRPSRARDDHFISYYDGLAEKLLDSGGNSSRVERAARLTLRINAMRRLLRRSVIPVSQES
jgi:glycosyltransferase involved in cell wall biosynthesis